MSISIAKKNTPSRVWVFQKYSEYIFEYFFQTNIILFMTITHLSFIIYQTNNKEHFFNSIIILKEQHICHSILFIFRSRWIIFFFNLYYLHQILILEKYSEFILKVLNFLYSRICLVIQNYTRSRVSSTKNALSI